MTPEGVQAWHGGYAAAIRHMTNNTPTCDRLLADKDEMPVVKKSKTDRKEHTDEELAGKQDRSKVAGDPKVHDRKLADRTADYKKTDSRKVEIDQERTSERGREAADPKKADRTADYHKKDSRKVDIDRERTCERDRKLADPKVDDRKVARRAADDKKGTKAGDPEFDVRKVDHHKVADRKMDIPTVANRKMEGNDKGKTVEIMNNRKVADHSGKSDRKMADNKSKKTAKPERAAQKEGKSDPAEHKVYKADSKEVPRTLPARGEPAAKAKVCDREGIPDGKGH